MQISLVFMTLYFLFSFSSQFYSLSLIIGSAIESGIAKTSMVMVFLTISSLIALLINIFKIKSTPLAKIWLPCAMIYLISAIIIVYSEVFSALWMISFFTRSVAAVVILAKIRSSVSLLFPENLLKANKYIQIISVIATLISFGLSPLVVSYLGLKTIFLIDVGIISLGVICLSIFFKSTDQNQVETNGIKQEVISSFRNLNKNNLLISVYTFLVWSVLGVFHVLEVPLLKERFDIQASEISLIFLLALSFNLISTYFTPEKILKKENLYKILGASALLMMMSGTCYLLTFNYTVVLLLIILIGFGNGVFNLSQTTIINNLPQEDSRSIGYILVNIFTNIGMLLSAGVIFLGENLGYLLQTVTIYAGILSGILIFLAITVNFKIKRSAYSYVSSFVLILFIIFPQISEAKTFKVPVDDIPKKLDPTNILDISSAFIMGQTYDTLYEYSSTNNLIPRLAKNHRISPDGKQIIIEINTQFQFSDGTPITSRSVALSLARTIRIMGESIKWAFGELEGFETFIKATNNKAEFPVGLKVISPTQIGLTLATPFPYFLQVLPAPYFAITKVIDNGQLVGTGDYEVQNISPEKLTLSLRQDRAKQYKNSPSKVEFIKVKSRSIALDLASKGLIDFTVIQNNKFLENKKPKNFDYKTFDYLQSMILQFNLQDKVFKSSLNRTQFSKIFSKIINKSKYKLTPTSVGVPLSWDLFKYTENSQKRSAKTVVDKSKKLQEVEVLFSDSAGIFKKSFNDELSTNLLEKGFKVRFHRSSVSSFFKRLKTGDFEVALWGYIPDYLDPDAFLTPLLKTNQQYNFSGYTNSTVDILLTLAREVPDQLSRHLIFDKIFAILQHENPVYFLGSQVGSYIISKNWQLNSIPGLGLHTIKIKNIVGVQ